MMRRKVLHIITGFSIGGAQMMLCNLLARTDRTRFEPVVLSLMTGGALAPVIEALEIPVHTLGMKSGIPAPGALVELIRLVRYVQPHMIQGWMYHGNLAAYLGALFSRDRIPVLWCIQNSFQSFAAEKRMTAAIIKLCARLSTRPAKIIYASHASRAQHEALGFYKDCGYVIPNGVDWARFVPSNGERESVRAELGLPVHTFLIGLIGRYHPQKDHTNFLSAAKLLLSRYPDVRFVLAGKDVDAANKALRDLVRDLGLLEQVHLLGERRDTARLTAALDIAASSSSYGEALSVSVTEAMSCGVPCVVTDVGDHGLLLGKTGIVVPPGDSQALANAWARLISAGAAARADLGRSARERIKQHYGIIEIAARYDELYSSIGIN